VRPWLARLLCAILGHDEQVNPRHAEPDVFWRMWCARCRRPMVDLFGKGDAVPEEPDHKPT
jgi:hypothetical protein